MILFLKISTEIFNKCDLKSYLKRSFEVCTKVKEVSAFTFFTIIHLCSSHIIKAIATNLSKVTKKNVLKVNFYFVLQGYKIALI